MRLFSEINARTSFRNSVIVYALSSAIVIWFMSLFLDSSEKTYINVLGIGGFVTQILGLIIAYFQIASVKEVADQTKTQVIDSIALNNTVLMISDLSRKAAIVDEIQGYLRDNKIEICILRMKDLKIILSSLKNQERYHRLFIKKNFNEIFATFNIDLDNFQRHFLNEKHKIDKGQILTNLEQLSTLLLAVEIKLKSPDHE